MEIGARCTAPAGEGTEVGGDFYDLFNVAEDEWIAVIGDVCGKGAEAAAVTALARYTIRTAAVRRRSPAAILRWLNDAMSREELDGRFCTIACAHVDTSRLGDPRHRLLRRAPAGAPAPRRWRRWRSRAGPARCSACSMTSGSTTSARSCAPGTPSCSTPTASRRRGRPIASSRCPTSPGARGGLEPATADRIVEELLRCRARQVTLHPPRDDIAVVALRARG